MNVSQNSISDEVLLTVGQLFSIRFWNVWHFEIRYMVSFRYGFGMLFGVRWSKNDVSLRINLDMLAFP